MSGRRPSPGHADRAHGRLFVALDLPDDVRDALARWRARALAELPVRPIAAGDLHVTLCFLGWRPLEQVESIADACALALGAASAPLLSLAESVWLPERRPRVIAVRTEDKAGALAQAHGVLSDALRRGGWYAPEARPFLGHVTVARIVRQERVRPLEVEPPPQLEFAGTEVTLYRSHLGAAGARYEALRTVSLDLSR